MTKEVIALTLRASSYLPSTKHLGGGGGTNAPFFPPPPTKISRTVSATGLKFLTTNTSP